MKVAIIGAGIAGLSAAYRLSPAHQVHIFERAAVAGGHAHTAVVETPEGPLPVDTGFIVYNERTYPGFSAMLRDLGVPTRPSDMSFGSSCLACGIDFSSRGWRGYFVRPGSLLRADHWRMLADLRAFYAEARRLLAGPERSPLSLGAYLERGRFGRALGRHYLTALAAAVWSTAPHEVLDFPLDHLLRFLDNHGLIGFGRAPRWRTIVGGSHEYVRRVLAQLPESAVHLGQPVRAVRGCGRTVELTLADGTGQRFDAAVIATHADEALALLADATPAEQRALGGFRYTANQVVLHTDESVLPSAPEARASWNVRAPDCARPAGRLTMTYDLTRLQGLPGPRRYLVSLNPPDLDPRAVIREYVYHHPRYDFETLAAQRRVGAIQGLRRIHFAGAYLGYGFHEDGHRAGTEAAGALTAAP